MFKHTKRYLALITLLLLVPVLLTACGGDDGENDDDSGDDNGNSSSVELSQQYDQTADMGGENIHMQFRYPEGWVESTEIDGGNFAVASSQEALDQLENESPLPAGGRAIMVATFPGAAMGIENLDQLIDLLVSDGGDAEFGERESLQIGGRDARYLPTELDTGSSAGAYFIQPNENQYLMVILVTAKDEVNEEARELAEAVVETVSVETTQAESAE